MRLAAVDATRTVAILGMFTVHLAGPAADRWPELASPRGFAAGGFAVLAGVSLGLTHRTERRGWRAWSGQLARSALLFALGVALTEITTGPVIILCVYAALFAVALPLRRLSGRTLIALGLAGTLVTPVVSFAIRSSLLDPPTDYSVTWEMLTGPDAAARVAQTVVLDGLYPLVTWLPLALIGWGAYRVGLLAPARLSRLAAVAAAFLLLGFGGTAAVESITHVRAEAIAEIERTLPENAHPALTNEELAARRADRGRGIPGGTEWDALLTTGTHTGTTLELWRIVGVAAAFLVGFGLLTRAAPAAARVLGWPGRIPLTVYSAHIVLAWLLLETGVVVEPGAVESLAVLAGYVAGAFLLGAAFRKGRGPLEALLRAVDRLVTGPRPALAPSTS